MQVSTRTKNAILATFCGGGIVALFAAIIDALVKMGMLEFGLTAIIVAVCGALAWPLAKGNK